MSKAEIGGRVGAILSAKDKKVNFIGWGTYLGYEVPPNRGPKSIATYLSEANIPNPKIQLDNGKFVFGSECWWGTVEEVEKTIAEYVEAGSELVEVDLYTEFEIPEEVPREGIEPPTNTD